MLFQKYGEDDLQQAIEVHLDSLKKEMLPCINCFMTTEVELKLKVSTDGKICQ